MRPAQAAVMMPCTGVASAAMAREMESGKLTRETVIPGFRFAMSSEMAGRPRIVGMRLSRKATSDFTEDTI